MTTELPPQVVAAVRRSIPAAEAFVVTVDATGSTPCAVGDDLSPGMPRDPAYLLTADLAARRCLENVRLPVDNLADWAAVLDSLLVCAVRTYDLDALATVLRAVHELGLLGNPLPARALGFLLAQQQHDGGFGFVAGQDGRAAEVRVALTRRCTAVLQRICEPTDSRIRKNPSSRSPSQAMPCRSPS